MELTFNNQFNESEAKRRWRRVFFALYAPVYVHYLLWAVMFCGIGMLIYDLRYFMIVLAAACVIDILSWYPRTWKVYRKIFRKLGSFERPTTVRLTDTFIEVACGENTAKNEYGVFSGFIELKDVIALINQKSIAATFEKKDFADGGEEFLQCLRQCGIKKIELWGFKRFAATFLSVVLMLLVALVCIVDIASARIKHRAYEIACQTQCCLNLKQITVGLLIYSDELNEAGIASLPPRLTVNDIIAARYVDGFHEVCPKSGSEYAYVPYRRLLDYNADTAANTPVLFDQVPGCHRERKHLLWGKETPHTTIAFEDGHVSIEENLVSFMDIHERYAPLMSPKDAEELRKFCADHDGIEP